MEKLTHILQDNLSVLSNTDILIIQKRILSISDGLPWSYYFKIAFIVVTGIIAITNHLSKKSIKHLNIKDPFKMWTAYLLFFLGGWLGLHHVYFRNTRQTVIRFSLSFLFLALNLNFFYAFSPSSAIIFNIHSYNLISQIILSIIGLLFTVDFFLIPYYTFKSNNELWRKHFETEGIIAKNKTLADEHLNKQTSILMASQSTYRKVDETLSDKSIREHIKLGVGGFFKNIATCGNQKALNNETGRLKTLQNAIIEAKEVYDKTLSYHDSAQELLASCRIDVYRNLKLAKEMVSIIKESVKHKESQLLLDEIQNFGSLDIDINDVNFAIQAFSDEQFTGKILDSFSNNMQRFTKNDIVLDKKNLTAAGLDIAIDLVGNLITEIINLNKEVSSKRLEVAEAQSKISSALIATNEASVALEANIRRINEIVTALNKVNKTFIRSYEPLRKQVFLNSSFKTYLSHKSTLKQLKTSPEFWKDIQLLMIISAEYNKINQAKVL